MDKEHTREKTAKMSIGQLREVLDILDEIEELDDRGCSHLDQELKLRNILK